jgi:alpha-tubulin suppressor-like RCC1 family protein
MATATATASATPAVDGGVEQLLNQLVERPKRVLLGCGDNRQHCLGIKADGAQEGAGALVRVNVGVLEPWDVKQIRAGSDFSAFLTETGEVYTCGARDYGEMGRHIPGDDEDPMELAQKTPTPIENPPRNIKEIAAGKTFLSCLTQEGHVYLCGGFRDEIGTILTPVGDDTFFGASHRIRRVPHLENVKHVFAGQSANVFLALGSDGKLYSCGTITTLFSSIERLRSTLGHSHCFASYRDWELG